MLRKNSPAAKPYGQVSFMRLLAAAGLAPACVLLGLAAPAVAAPGLATAPGVHDSGYKVSPVKKVSTCGGYNAEVVQATAKPHYVYEAWIGCGGEGFARSVDGGAHFSAPVTLPESSGSDDPAKVTSSSKKVSPPACGATTTCAVPLSRSRIGPGHSTSTPRPDFAPSRAGLNDHSR